MTELYCNGIECPVRKTCRRFTEKGDKAHINKCTNQKKYVKDYTK